MFWKLRVFRLLLVLHKIADFGLRTLFSMEWILCSFPSGPCFLITLLHVGCTEDFRDTIRCNKTYKYFSFNGPRGLKVPFNLKVWNIIFSRHFLIILQLLRNFYYFSLIFKIKWYYTSFHLYKTTKFLNISHLFVKHLVYCLRMFKLFFVSLLKRTFIDGCLYNLFTSLFKMDLWKLYEWQWQVYDSVVYRYDP